MKFFKNLTGEVHGYDETYENDHPYIDAAIEAGWEDVTSSWPPHPAPAPKILATLNPAQIRMQLSRLGLRDQVEQAVTNGNQDLKDLWEYAPVFKIDDQNIQALAVQLGVNQAQLEQLFIDGAQL